MKDLIDSTQRWWASTRPTAFFAGAQLHLCDTPNPEDWARMYRWKLCKDHHLAAAITSLVALSVLVVLMLTPMQMFGKTTCTILAALVFAITGAAALLMGHRAHRKPFSIITLPVQMPTPLEEELEELWPQLDDRMKEGLRKELIRTFESKKQWSPQALQQAVLTRIQRYRTLANDG